MIIRFLKSFNPYSLKLIIILKKGILSSMTFFPKEGKVLPLLDRLIAFLSQYVKFFVQKNYFTASNVKCSDG